ncbi:MAG: hydantoinase/oxoprolinase family protein, partial [bacterium]
RRQLQEAIDEASSARLGDRIAVGYGLCGMGAVGIHVRDIPLAFPRVHDCIALFLGSDTAYKEQFAKFPGTYYISAGWVDEKVQPKPMQDGTLVKIDPTCFEFGELVEKYGKENAEAIRYFLSSWQRNYQRAVFIDTGTTTGKRKYADLAKAMAKEFGWRYEELPGAGDLLAKLLTVPRSTEEVVVVPPFHVTAYDAVREGLTSVPIRETENFPSDSAQTLVFEQDSESAQLREEESARFGLGIDAGGTYTDAVLYDFDSHAVVGKAKSLTTKWDFTIGIDDALSQLPQDQLSQVDLVSISTTLATNAIVEGRGQKVGLLVMPPYGLFDPSDILHRPLAVIDGRLDFDGSEIAPIDPGQVRQVLRDMVERQQVGAFAVAGFASDSNPSHELQVKAIIREETNMSVTCGDDVSELLNYRVRAQTAALNARIIPNLEALLDEVQISLERRGIHAPAMVVRSDGSLMSLQTARQRPIETILSGPAASVAGARFLAKSTNAIVVDMGGTTTDTAIIKDGAVQVCEKGAFVGGWRTHVKALDMRTLGLGGDSLIAYEKRRLQIGPRRVAPVSWLAAHQRNGAEAFDWLERHLDYFEASTQRMDLIMLNGHEDHGPLNGEESRVFEMLRERPHSIHELSHRVSGNPWRLPPLERLEENHLIQRCGLTPTDLLHVTGQVDLWDVEAAVRLCDLFGKLVGMKRNELAEHVIQQIIRNLTVELLKKQMDKQIDPNEIDHSPSAKALVDNLLNGGGEGYSVRVKLQDPVIGIGAPVHFFLPKAAELLETKAVIPPNADVANAVGAITSSVIIHKQVKISPNPDGEFNLYGLTDAPTFPEFEKAQEYAVDQLQKIVRQMAREAGTSQTRVEIVMEDQIAPLADGGEQFLGRTLEARLSGRPDIARLVEGGCS